MRGNDEKSKYDFIWDSIDYSSKYNKMEIAEKMHGKVLDVGCGNGTFVYYLNSRKEVTEAHGCDITDKGIKRMSMTAINFKQCPAWDMPYEDNYFDVVTSCDVLEHIPPDKLDAAIAELKRVGRKQIHVIATFKDHKYFGYKVHLSVHPIEWWREKFSDTDLIIERKLGNNGSD